MRAPVISFIILDSDSKCIDVPFEKEDLINKAFFSGAEIFVKAKRDLTFCHGYVEVQTTVTTSSTKEFNHNLIIMNLRRSKNKDENEDSHLFLWQQSDFVVVIAPWDDSFLAKAEPFLQKGGTLLHLSPSRLDERDVESFCRKYPKYLIKRLQPEAGENSHHALSVADAEDVGRWIRDTVNQQLSEKPTPEWKNLEEKAEGYKFNDNRSGFILKCIRECQSICQNDFVDEKERKCLQNLYEHLTPLNRRIARSRLESDDVGRLESMRIADEVGIRNRIAKQMHPAVARFASYFIKLNLSSLKVFLTCLEQSAADAQAAVSVASYFREMTYWCEALLSNGVADHGFVDSVARKMAELVFEGHSYELMDGMCAGFNPLFTELLFKKIIEKLGGDKRVMVVSVLGTKKSGNSTLLNTMFNLNFPVSTAKCTLGISMQILEFYNFPSKENYENLLDYIIVLDTEGLTTAAMGKNTGDEIFSQWREVQNEFATFVSTISSVLIINNRDTSDTTMHDFLQVVCSATVKLKRLMREDQIRTHWKMVYNRVTNTSEVVDTMREQNKSLSDDLHSVVFNTRIILAGSLYYPQREPEFYKLFRFSDHFDVFYTGNFRGDFSAMSGYIKDVLKVKAGVIGSRHFLAKLPKFSELANKVTAIYSQIQADDCNYRFCNLIDIECYIRADTIFQKLNSDFDQEATEIRKTLKLRDSDGDEKNFEPKTQSWLFKSIELIENKTHRWNDILLRARNDSKIPEPTNNNYNKYLDFIYQISLRRGDELKKRLTEECKMVARISDTITELTLLKNQIASEIFEKMTGLSDKVSKNEIDVRRSGDGFTSDDLRKTFEEIIWIPIIKNATDKVAEINRSFSSNFLLDVKTQCKEFLSSMPVLVSETNTYLRRTDSPPNQSDFLSIFRNCDPKDWKNLICSHKRRPDYYTFKPSPQRSQLELDLKNYITWFEIDFDEFKEEEITRLQELVELHQKIIRVVVMSSIEGVVVNYQYDPKTCSIFLAGIYNKYKQFWEDERKGNPFNNKYYAKMIFYACDLLVGKIEEIKTNVLRKVNDALLMIEKDKQKYLDFFVEKCNNSPS